MLTGLGYTRWRKVLWAVAVLLIIASSAAWLEPLRADDNEEFVPDQVVVKLDLVGGATIEAINATYGTTTLDTFLASAGIYLLQVASGEDVESMVDMMEDDSRLLYVEPNFINEMPEGDPSETWAWGGYDPQPYLGQYAADMLNLAEAHQMALGAGVVVAVLDSGAQLDHPQLAEKFTANGYDFVDDDAQPDDLFNGADDDNDGLIDEGAGHGTHVAGVINLVAPAAHIMPLRVLDSDGRGNHYVLAEAIQYAGANGADVINLSLGTMADSQLMQDSLRVARQTGAVIVAAAGNLNSNNVQYPAAYADVLGVTAVGPGFIRASFANYGDWVNLAAPGRSITSTFPIDGYAQWSGTSMATPFVAGQVALVRDRFPDLSPDNVAAVIQTTAWPIDALNPGYEGLLGAGAVDAAASLNYAPVEGLTAVNNGGVGLGETSRLTATISSGSFVSYTWSLGDGNVGYGAAITHAYSESGVFTAVVTASNALGVLTATTSVTVFAPDVLYVSAKANGAADDLPFRDEDILRFDSADDEWEMYFDGSDVGLGATDVDAFTLTPEGDILLSLDAAAFNVPGLGQVDDADIVKFIPTSTGSLTAGSFEMYLDGSDVGLESEAEDIDALWLAPNGDLIISTLGNFSAQIAGKDEDLLRFRPLSLGWDSAGQWAIYFDGSDVGLTAAAEDVGGVWIDGQNGAVYLSVAGAFSVTGSGGAGLDIFVCRPQSLGNNTQCTFGPGVYWEGAATGFSGGALDGFFVLREP